MLCPRACLVSSPALAVSNFRFPRASLPQLRRRFLGDSTHPSVLIGRAAIATGRLLACNCRPPILHLILQSTCIAWRLANRRPLDWLLGPFLISSNLGWTIFMSGAIHLFSIPDPISARVTDLRGRAFMISSYSPANPTLCLPRLLRSRPGELRRTLGWEISRSAVRFRRLRPSCFRS